MDILRTLDPWSLLVGSLTVIFGVVTILSLALMMYYQRVNRRLYRQRYSYSWSDILQGTYRIHSFLRRRRFNPSAIISFSGSGGVVANLLLLLIGNRLPLYQVMIADLSSPWASLPTGYLEVTTSRHKIYIPQNICSLPPESRIALVDAVCVTGTNAHAVLSHLRSQGYARILYTVLLQVQPVHEIVCPPDYFCFNNPTTEWYWPWGKGK